MGGNRLPDWNPDEAERPRDDVWFVCSFRLRQQSTSASVDSSAEEPRDVSLDWLFFGVSAQVIKMWYFSGLFQQDDSGKSRPIRSVKDDRASLLQRENATANSELSLRSESETLTYPCPVDNTETSRRFVSANTVFREDADQNSGLFQHLYVKSRDLAGGRCRFGCCVGVVRDRYTTVLRRTHLGRESSEHEELNEDILDGLVQDIDLVRRREEQLTTTAPQLVDTVDKPELDMFLFCETQSNPIETGCLQLTSNPIHKLVDPIQSSPTAMLRPHIRSNR